MEQELGATVTFVPHLVPLDRGILETIYVKVAPGTTAEQIVDAFQHAYANEPFVAADRATRCRRSSTSRTRISATSAGATSRRRGGS